MSQPINFTGAHIITDELIVIVKAPEEGATCELCGHRDGDPDEEVHSPVYRTVDRDAGPGHSDFMQCGDCLAASMDAARAGMTNDNFLFPLNR